MRLSRMLTILGVAALFASTSQGAILTFTTLMDGPSESPPNASTGTGSASLEIDTLLHTMRVQASFSGLTGTSTLAHVHATTAAPFTGTSIPATQTPSFSGFPTGVTAGAYDMTFDLTLASSYNPAFVTANGGTIAGAESALISALTAGRAYFNVHTSTFGGGEIRGFFPEPASLALLAACAGFLVRRR